MNIGEDTFAAEFAVVDDVVQSTAPEFEVRGFRLTNATMEGSPLVLFRVYHFVNDRLGLRLELSFFPARDGLNGGFNTLIINREDLRLDVLDYFKIRGRSDLRSLFLYRDPATDLRGFAESTIRMLLDLLDNELKPIVDGTTFEETPIDWQGYK